MLNFNWNTIDDSTFQGQLNKYTNAFKGFQTRYFVLDAQTKNLLYFMTDEVRKKGPKGVIELTDCWISPSNEDDVTFTVQTGSGESFKLRASDAKSRQKWIDKLRACSGTNSPNVYVSTLSISKEQRAAVSTLPSSTNETQIQSLNRKHSKSQHHQQTVKDLKEVIHCVEINQRDFVETIDAIPDSSPINPLSKEMLLLRSISQSCISSLEDSLMILTRRRTPDNEPLPVSIPSNSSPQSSTAINNTSNCSLSPSSTNSTRVKSSLSVDSSSQTNLYNSQNRNSSLDAYSLPNESIISTKNLRINSRNLNCMSQSAQ